MAHFVWYHICLLNLVDLLLALRFGLVHKDGLPRVEVSSRTLLSMFLAYRQLFFHVIELKAPSYSMMHHGGKCPTIGGSNCDTCPKGKVEDYLCAKLGNLVKLIKWTIKFPFERNRSKDEYSWEEKYSWLHEGIFVCCIHHWCQRRRKIKESHCETRLLSIWILLGISLLIHCWELYVWHGELGMFMSNLGKKHVEANKCTLIHSIGLKNWSISLGVIPYRATCLIVIKLSHQWNGPFV